MSALFNFDAFCLVMLLIICTCTYAKQFRKNLFKREHRGIYGFCYKCAVIGDRLSPLVSLGCIGVAFRVLVS
ncbi:Protein kish [Diplonema papillatum]|nr:Protein kish [Diplonema papillatum]